MSTALSVPQSPLVPEQQLLSDDWKQEVAERLDAYRAHRPRVAVQPPAPARRTDNSRATKIARAVASRYAAAPTYSELLAAAARAAEAQAAARAEAQAAEERRLQQAAEAAQESERNLFQDLDADDSVQSAPFSTSTETLSGNRPGDGERAFSDRYGSAIVTQSLQPVIPGKAVMPQFAARTREIHLHQTALEPEPSLEDLLASALVEPRAMLPSKLIEFPRELVSSRRARPHLPEVPSGDQDLLFQEQETAQLRIFEVQPEVEVSATPGQDAIVLSSAPEIAAAATDPVVSAVAPPAAEPNSGGNSTPSSKSASAPLHPATNRVTYSAAGESRRGISGTVASASKTPPANTFRGLEWASISLDKEPASYRRRAETSVADYVPFMVDPASIDRRVMAFAVDFAAVTAGFLGFLAVFAAATPHLPTGLTAVALAGAVYAALWVLYQMLFFSLSGATAGMLYAHIALCTFDDQNPPRAALQRRLGAWWLSLLPLGIGFLWCFVDEDNLCWHDRITRTYQREY